MRKSFCLVQLVEHELPDDWEQWPEQNRKICESAISRTMKDCGDGVRIVEDVSRCTYRNDLKDVPPWQLYLEISVEVP